VAHLGIHGRRPWRPLSGVLLPRQLSKGASREEPPPPRSSRQHPLTARDLAGGGECRWPERRAQPRPRAILGRSMRPVGHAGFVSLLAVYLFYRLSGPAKVASSPAASLSRALRGHEFEQARVSRRVVENRCPRSDRAIHRQGRGSGRTLASLKGIHMAQLYRHFDATGRLLYAGISLFTFRRLAAHERIPAGRSWRASG
jgi:hypothetical protein